MAQTDYYRALIIQLPVISCQSPSVTFSRFSLSQSSRKAKFLVHSTSKYVVQDDTAATSYGGPRSISSLWNCGVGGLVASPDYR